MEQRKPGSQWIPPWAQFTVSAEINRVKPAWLSRQPCFPCAPHSCYNNVAAKGPWKGLPLRLAAPQTVRTIAKCCCQIVAHLFPLRILRFSTAWGKKKKKRVHLYVCVIRVSLCVFAGSRGDSCFGLIYQCWYQRLSSSEHILRSLDCSVQLLHFANANTVFSTVQNSWCTSFVNTILFLKNLNLRNIFHIHYWKQS